MFTNMTKMANSVVGKIALLLKLAFLWKVWVGDRSIYIINVTSTDDINVLFMPLLYYILYVIYYIYIYIYILYVAVILCSYIDIITLYIHLYKEL